MSDAINDFDASFGAAMTAPPPGGTMLDLARENDQLRAALKDADAAADGCRRDASRLGDELAQVRTLLRHIVSAAHRAPNGDGSIGSRDWAFQMVPTELIEEAETRLTEVGASLTPPDPPDGAAR